MNFRPSFSESQDIPLTFKYILNSKLGDVGFKYFTDSTLILFPEGTFS